MLKEANRIGIERILAELGMAMTDPRFASLIAFDEATELVPTAYAVLGESRLLSPSASAAWIAMAEAAAAAGATLELISGFRSYAYQAELIRKKRDAGRALEDILKSVAPPGFSEHHTGEAADIGSPGCENLTASFAKSGAFAWLAANARRFGWTMSYPEGNKYGYVYEPWHWKWNPTQTIP